VKEAIGRGLTAYTPKTITKREAVLAMLTKRGCAATRSTRGERRRAARHRRAGRNHNGAVIAALGVAAPVQRMNKKLMQTCVPSVDRDRRRGVGAARLPAVALARRFLGAMVSDGEKKRRHTLADHLYGSDTIMCTATAAPITTTITTSERPVRRGKPALAPRNLSLASVGIDIGSAGTQVIFSRLHMRRLGEDLSSRYSSSPATRCTIARDVHALRRRRAHRRAGARRDHRLTPTRRPACTRTRSTPAR